MKYRKFNFKTPPPPKLRRGYSITYWDDEKWTTGQIWSAAEPRGWWVVTNGEFVRVKSVTTSGGSYMKRAIENTMSRR